MHSKVLRAEEPLVIEITFDQSYMAWQPNRAYGWQILDGAGDVLSWHYHAEGSADMAEFGARQRFGSTHPYTVRRRDQSIG